MPVKTRRNYQKNTRSMRKSYKKYSKYTKNGQRNVKGIYSFKRTFTTTIDVVNQVSGVITGDNGKLTTGVGLRFQDLPSYTEFTGLFDQYRICAIKSRFTPDYNDAVSGTTAAYVAPMLVTVYDQNDVNILVNRPTALQYQSFKETPSYKPRKIYAVPKIALPAYKTGITWGYTQAKGKPWINSSNPDVEYYAYKWALFFNTAGTGSERVGKIVVDTTVYFQCKQVN